VRERPYEISLDRFRLDVPGSIGDLLIVTRRLFANGLKRSRACSQSFSAVLTAMPRTFAISVTLHPHEISHITSPWRG
jgi:hypothetical protein